VDDVTPTRFVDLLVAATVGVYVLVLAGATTAIADATRACTAWPGCDSQWLPPASSDVAIALGHRFAAVVVGALVLAVAVVAWRRAAPRRVRAATLAALVLYPVQVGVGAVTALTGGTVAVATLHLSIAVVIFGALVLALAWTLEDATPDDETTTDAPRRAPDDDDPAPAGTGPLATVRAYLRLTKPRLMWLLCLVAGAGMALAAGPSLSARTAALTLGGGVLAIGASGTFNNVLERDVDRKMARTADRPVAREQVPARRALAFGVALAVASVAVFLQVNPLAAGLGLVAILYYSVVYTLVLKPNTVQNTVIGGFAGSLPALIGWAAVTGTLGVPALALAGVIFVWTPAHFYNLALAYRDDYASGGFPMMPVVRGASETRKHIVLWLGATLVAATALTAVTSLGPLYATTSVAFGAVFLWAVVRLHRERSRAAALRAFHASNAYLGTLLLAIVADALAL
jgi:protoheme IX farnesyltransferase